ncbi:unnamed protein product [Linum trigynum]|uniref:Uncharacterized protein n=1 Tax=Linum trigynum TaxID=586398 RepID=A0AAV2DN22_9ROSI
MTTAASTIVDVAAPPPPSSPRRSTSASTRRQQRLDLRLHSPLPPLVAAAPLPPLVAAAAPLLCVSRSEMEEGRREKEGVVGMTWRKERRKKKNRDGESG